MCDRQKPVNSGYCCSLSCYEIAALAVSALKWELKEIVSSIGIKGMSKSELWAAFQRGIVRYNEVNPMDIELYRRPIPRIPESERRRLRDGAAS